MYIVRCAQYRAALAAPFGEVWRIYPAIPWNVEESFLQKMDW